MLACGTNFSVKLIELSSVTTALVPAPVGPPLSSLLAPVPLMPPGRGLLPNTPVKFPPLNAPSAADTNPFIGYASPGLLPLPSTPLPPGGVLCVSLIVLTGASVPVLTELPGVVDGSAFVPLEVSGLVLIRPFSNTTN